MPAPAVILVCQDLIFTTKVSGTAAGLDIELKVVGSTEQAKEMAGDATRLIMVDLSNSASTTPAQLRELRGALPVSTRVLAYGSHVEVPRLKAAREAGCDPVLPRSEFTDRLTAYRNLMELRSVYPGSFLVEEAVRAPSVR